LPSLSSHSDRIFVVKQVRLDVLVAVQTYVRLLARLYRYWEEYWFLQNSSSADLGWYAKGKASFVGVGAVAAAPFATMVLVVE
jgi:hypothetical protein